LAMVVIRVNVPDRKDEVDENASFCVGAMG
jgi:hypothetical protein